MRRYIYILLTLLAAVFCSCTDDDHFSTSASDKLTFSADTLTMDTVFCGVASSTYGVMVYNHTSSALRISNVSLLKGNQTGFRVNVDGTYLNASQGYQTGDIELHKGDSIRVFVEITSPQSYQNAIREISDNLIFTLESGMQQKLCLRAYSMDAAVMNNVVVHSDSVLSSDKPILVYGGLKVDSGAVLTVSAGTTIYFHNGAGLEVYGTLNSMGEVARPVTMRGDRLDHMFSYLPYDYVSGQWNGIRLHSSSYSNKLYNTDIHGANYGIQCDSSDVKKTKLEMYNCIVHNCKGYGISAVSSVLSIENTQVSNTLGDCVRILGGSATILHCTLAQFYPFDAQRGVAMSVSNVQGKLQYPLYQLQLVNNIITGYGDKELVMERDTTVSFSYLIDHNLICSSPTVDKYMIGNLWESKDSTAAQTANFRRIDTDSLRYDFRLDCLSRAIGAANKSYALPYDRNGISRGSRPSMGCYE